jgi:hypothetical protein
MGQLVLKRASASRSSGEWGDDDYDVLADGVMVGRIFKAARRRPWARRGCGRCSTASTRTARRRTATRGRARPQWRRSPRAGDGVARAALGEAVQRAAGALRLPDWDSLRRPESV